MKHICENVTVTDSGCWEWNLSCSSSGYGQFTYRKRYWNTHRYVWEFHNGTIENGAVIRHLCHNRKCCNILHLNIGSHKDNYNDSVDVHASAAKERRNEWHVGNNTFLTSRDAVKNTGISIHSIIKFTNEHTRVFDILAYRESTIRAGWVPKI